MYDRTFGVEIEAFLPHDAVPRGDYYHSPKRFVADKITEAGVRCIETPYGHRQVTTWETTHDGSLVGPGHAMEIKSLPLSGVDGLEQIMTVGRVMGNLRMGVNSTCGLHVHVDARGLSVPAMRKLALDYARAERIIDSLLPPSRRGSTSRYARSIARADFAAVAAAPDATALANVLYGRPADTGRRRRRRSSFGYSDVRWVKLNFAATWRHGTVEFRHHSGTVDPVKIVNWVKLCLRMVDKAASDPTIANMPRGRAFAAGTWYARFTERLLSPEGLTREEARAMAGWTDRSHVSLVSLARHAGASVRTAIDPATGHKRYWATLMTTTPDATPEVPVTNLEGFLAKYDVPDDEKKYWNERHALFASVPETGE